MLCPAIAVVASLGLVAQNGSESGDDDAVAPSLPRDDDSGPGIDELREMLEEHEARLEEHEARLRQQESKVVEAPIVRFSGYADAGFFAPIGNDGVGWIRDFSNDQFPEYAGQFGWVFLGDILATTINTRGEVADLGDGPGVERFDSVNSRGAMGFIVNEVNMRMEVQAAERVLLRTSLNVVPRTGSDFALGDFIDMDIAEAEWVVTEDGNTSVWVGKTLPVFGIEYTERKSDQRFGVTPSLIQRYTSGPQLAVKARTKLFDQWLIVAGSVSNGSPTTEQFHFYDEVDSNDGKTFNGRVAVNVPIEKLVESMTGHRLEVGFSGVWGPQDRATNNEEPMWFVGVDLQYRTAEFALKAQWMRGGADGLADQRVWGLELNDSGYVEVNWMVLPYLGLIGRAGLRDAIVTLTDERLYLTKSYRLTGGVRAVLNEHIAMKAEYLHNREYGNIAEFQNDIITTSLVVSY